MCIRDSPKPFARCPLGSESENPERLVPPPFEDRRGTPRHHPTRLRRLVEHAIPHDGKPSMYHMLVLYVVLETSDRLMLYQSEPSKPTRCYFGHSCHDVFPRRPMKNTSPIPAFAKRWRTCNRQPIRCACSTRPGLEASSTAAPASILRWCWCWCRCCRCLLFVVSYQVYTRIRIRFSSLLYCHRQMTF